MFPPYLLPEFDLLELKSVSRCEMEKDLRGRMRAAEVIPRRRCRSWKSQELAQGVTGSP